MANFLSQKWLLNRRHVLRGVGATMALPFLECMQPLRAAEPTTDRARRSIFIYLPNGENTHDYEMKETGRDYQLSRVLSPLEKHRQNVSPVSGLYHPNSFGVAHNATQTWLTGAKHGPNDRNTISVDQLIAQVVGPKTRFPSLELSNQGQPLSVSADGIALPAERNPAVVFQNFFTEPKDGITKQRRSLQRKQSILDVVLGDAKSLACHPASTTHRQMTVEEQRKAGISPDTIRLSIGIETCADLLADLDQALHAV